MVFIVIEPLDGKILHALQLSPRVSFRRIADVVDAPEQTVARRYRKLQRDGVVRVIGLVNPQVHGECQWVVRVHAKPDDLPRLAEALVRRPEVTHANVLSGWTELVCIIRAPLGETKDGILQRLPRTSAVLGLEVDLILREFGEPASAPWTAYGHTLEPGQAALIQRYTEALSQPISPAKPSEEDQPLFDVLAADGRAAHARLARHLGWSAARVKRRIAALEASGTLAFDVDVLPNRFGFNVNAMLWLTTPPRHLAAVAEQIAAHEEIATVCAVSGRNNLLAVVIGRDVDDLYRYLAERLAGVEHIQSYDLSIRAQRLKQAASLIAHGRLIHPGHA
ncbi:MAG TPA: Lrp/AsnC family transcriptional regulator [Mycobacterium sp.]|nr:Lrp/AsnC family transcriptional regulator [Mycobacterium sp.]